jgi:basic membrane protein A
VDADQSRSDPRYANVILASMVKRVDTAVYRAIERRMNGEHDGETHALGLERDGLEVAYGAEIGDAVPASIKRAVADSRTAIVQGSVDVPEVPSLVAPAGAGGVSP